MAETVSGDFVSMGMDAPHGGGVWASPATGAASEFCYGAAPAPMGAASSLGVPADPSLGMTDPSLSASPDAASHPYPGGGGPIPCGSAAAQTAGAFLGRDGGCWLPLANKQPFLDSPESLSLHSQMAAARGECGSEWLSMMPHPPTAPQGLCGYQQMASAPIQPPLPSQSAHDSSSAAMPRPPPASFGGSPSHSSAMLVGPGSSVLSGGDGGAYSVPMQMHAETATAGGGAWVGGSCLSGFSQVPGPADAGQTQTAFHSTQALSAAGEAASTGQLGGSPTSVSAQTACGDGGSRPPERAAAGGARLKRRPRQSCASGMGFGGDPVAKAVAAAADKGLSPAGTRPAKYFKQRASSKASLKASLRAGKASASAEGLLGVGGGGVFGEGVKRELTGVGCAMGGAASTLRASDGGLEGDGASRTAQRGGCRVRGGGSSEVMAKMYFHRKKEAWRAELLIQGTKKQKSFSCRLYGYDRARMMCEWARKFVLYTSRLPTDEETCSSLAALMCDPLPEELPPPFPEGSPCLSGHNPSSGGAGLQTHFSDRGSHTARGTHGGSHTNSSFQGTDVSCKTEGGTGASGMKASFNKASLWRTKGGSGNACRQKRRELLKMVTSASGEKLSALSLMAQGSGTQDSANRRVSGQQQQSGFSEGPHSGHNASSSAGSCQTGYGCPSAKGRLQALTLNGQSGSIPAGGGRHLQGGLHTPEGDDAAFSFGCDMSRTDDRLGMNEENNARGGGSGPSGGDGSGNGGECFKTEFSQNGQEPMFEELAPLKKLTRPKGGRAKRFNVGKKPFSGVRGIYFQQGLWKVKYKGDQEEAMKLFPYVSGDERDMLLQFEQARAFLRQVIEKGRHLHDSDGEGLSEDEPAWLGRGLATRSLSKRDAQGLARTAAEDGVFGQGGSSKNLFVNSGSSRRRLALSGHSPLPSASGAALSGRDGGAAPPASNASPEEEATGSSPAFPETTSCKTNSSATGVTTAAGENSSASCSALCRIMEVLPQHVRDAAEGFQASSGMSFFQPVYRQPTEGPQAALWGARTDSVCTNIHKIQNRLAGERRKHRPSGRGGDKACAGTALASKSLQELTTDDSLGSAGGNGGGEAVASGEGVASLSAKQGLFPSAEAGDGGASPSWLCSDLQLEGAKKLFGEDGFCGERRRLEAFNCKGLVEERPPPACLPLPGAGLPFHLRPELVADCAVMAGGDRISSSAAFTADLPEEVGLPAAPSCEAFPCDPRMFHLDGSRQQQPHPWGFAAEDSERSFRGGDCLSVARKASRRARSGGTGRGASLRSSEEMSQDLQCMASYPWDCFNDFFSAASSPQRLRTAASAVALLRPASSSLGIEKESPRGAGGCEGGGFFGDEPFDVGGFRQTTLRGCNAEDSSRTSPMDCGLQALKLRMSVARSSGVGDSSVFLCSPTWRAAEFSPDSAYLRYEANSLSSEDFAAGSGGPSDRESVFCGDGNFRLLQSGASAPSHERGLLFNRDGERASGEGLRAARSQSRGGLGFLAPSSPNGQCDVSAPWSVVTPPQDALGYVLSAPSAF